MKPFINILFGVLLVVLVGVGQVRGQCIDNISTEYFQDFEADIIEECWYIYDGDGDGYNWTYINNSSYAHSGTWARISYSYISGVGDVKPDNYLYTAWFTVPTTGNCDFSWWHRKYSSAWDDYYSVWIHPQGDEYMYRIGEANRSSTVSYEYDKISLNDYKGQTIRIIFRHWNSDGQWALLIDDISIEWDNPLPIVLLDFYAEPRPGFNMLTIITGYEYNNCEFIVYRSRDAINWDYNNPVRDWDFGRDSALYNEVLDTVLNYFNIEHPNGQTYYPTDYEPYDTTYYKLVQRDCDGRLTEYESEIIVCIQEPSNKIEPRAYTDNGIVLVAGDRMCDVYVYTILGTQRYTKRMYPGETGRLNYWGHYIVEFVWVDENTYDIRKKVYKLFNIE